MKKVTMTAVSQVVRNTGKGASKTPWVSCVSVMLGEAQVAVATLGGRYSSEAGLAEFKKTATNPRWKRMGGWDTAVVAGMVPGVRPVVTLKAA